MEIICMEINRILSSIGSQIGVNVDFGVGEIAMFVQCKIGFLGESYS
jgi:hypothetical protein